MSGRARGRLKSRCEKQVSEESTIGGGRFGSEVIEENHIRGKDEKGIRIGTKEMWNNSSQIKSSRTRTELLLSHQESTATNNNYREEHKCFNQSIEDVENDETSL